jgi:hypothetical protein
MLKLIIIMWLVTPDIAGWTEVDRYETKGECWKVALQRLADRHYGPHSAIQCLHEGETP